VRPTLAAAATGGRPLIVTVPIIGLRRGRRQWNGARDASRAFLSAGFEEVAKKSTIYPGSPLSLTPNKTDGYVFTDEFVNWVEKTKQPSQQVFLRLGQ